MPPGVTSADLVPALAAGWDITVDELTFRPVGAGSYHWTAGDRWWVTVHRADDFDLLDAAMRTAAALRLDFVVAPVGTPVRRLVPGYAVSVFPLVDGVAGEFGPHPPADLPAVTDLLIALHDATPSVAGIAPVADLRLPGRSGLLTPGDSWGPGPYAAAARDLLAAHTGTIRDWLAEYDDLVATLGSHRVVTHGEPHPGNILRTAPGLRLIDWDTVAVAPPERDLWMIADDAVFARYERATGHRVSPAAIDLYRLRWKLADILVYTADLRRPHRTGGDAEASLTYLTNYFR
jgi:spectinomycin phosphotransferase